MALPSRRRLALAAVLLAACGSTATPGAPAPTAVGSFTPPPTAVAVSSGTVPPLPSPLPTASGTTTITAPERDVWAQVRARLPQGSPVAAPTWLPAVLDRDRVAISDLSARPADPRYVVTYSGAGRAIEFGMGGSGPPEGQSGLGTRVRRSAAVLSFPPSLFFDPSTPATRVVRWQEAGRALWVSSSTFTGGDLLHVAWELDLASAPAAAHPYERVREGACASTSKPEDTIDRLMSLIGSGDRDAVLDCFALDLIDVYAGFGGWSALPKAIDRAQRAAGEVGGRFQIYGTWTFASEPVLWTQGSRASQFFQLGMDGGRWRVFEVGTAAYGSPP